MAQSAPTARFIVTGIIVTGIDEPVRPPGDDKHLSRLLNIWAGRKTPVTAAP